MMERALREEMSDMRIALTSPLWLKAVEYLRKDIDENNLLPEIRGSIAKDPLNWYVPYHFGWGMAIRNFLRKGGFGEKEFGILNIDNIYVKLIEQAVLHDHP